MQKNDKRRIPVILDTDVGSDIDDMWAIVMMLNSPELDVKLIVTEFGNTLYRAKIVAKLLEVAGRTDIPIGIGIPLSNKVECQGPWVEDYDFDSYKGIVFQDGVDAMIDEIMNSEETVSLIAIGPVTNIAAALERQPAITERARFIGMQGSVRKGYRGDRKAVPEYNVYADISACKTVFTADWEMTITPIDSCGLVQLKGDKYQNVHHSQTKLMRALMENYRIWDGIYPGRKFSEGYGKESTILFDTVAVYLAFEEELLVMEELGIRINETGSTVIDETAKKIKCATGWKDLHAFEDLLIDRLLTDQ